MPKENNFDAMRLFFALAVIITHSYAIVGASEENDLLFRFTNSSLNFASLGVGGFFIISGYLIMESMERSYSMKEYYLKRVLRIFPGLLAVLLVTVVLGMFVSKLPLLAYISNGDAITYVLHNITMVKLQHTISGVYEENPYPRTINASLWTIQYEFLFYILLSSLFFIRGNKQVLLWLMPSLFVLVYIVHLFYTGRNFDRLFTSPIPYTTFNFWALSHFGMYFLAGSILSVVKIHHFRYNSYLLICTLLLTFAAMATGLYAGKASYLLLPPLVILLGLKASRGLTGINKLAGGDLSYGIYLYGFLIQQTLVYFIGNLWAKELTMLAVPIALVCGYLSWNLVEKYPLKLKTRYSRIPITMRVV